MAAKKEENVGDYTVRYGKDPDDPDSVAGWRIFTDSDEIHEESDVWGTKEEAIEAARDILNREQCEELKEQITVALEGCEEPETLKQILALLE
jgi:hypothetical protein